MCEETRRMYVYEIWHVVNKDIKFTDDEAIMTLHYQRNYDNIVLKKELRFAIASGRTELLVQPQDTIVYETTTDHIRAFIDPDGKFKMTTYH